MSTTDQAGTASAVSKEDLLKIFIDTDPTARSPYALYGNPPMWPVAEEDDKVLMARRTRTLNRVNFAFEEVDGVSWQWHQDGVWLDQGRQADYDHFLGEMEKIVQRGGRFLPEGAASLSVAPADDAPAPWSV